MPTTIINVSNRLPVTVGETITSSSGGLVAALEGLSRDEYTMRWIGWPGTEIEEPQRQQEIQRILETEHGLTPVFLTDDEITGYYEGFANASVWPLLHYMPSKFRYDAAWWEQYRSVNEKFAENVASVARDGDLVWVHDYQLMLVPQMLRAKNPTLRIGFFLHTPFPSYEVFRCHPNRNDLVAGLLGADLIGFHTFGYLRHFRSSVLRLLGIESEVTRIRRDGHVSRMDVFPIGINAKKFAQELEKPELPAQVETFQKNFDGKRIVLSVERLDYTKGILHRLDAIDAFLSSHADRDRIKFIFVSVPSREGVEEYQSLRDEVEQRVGRINGKYTSLHNAPVHFIHGSVNFTQLTALYSLADVALVTPLIDGMNLVAKEYIASQGDEPGVLILSEFAGAAEELFNAVIVNPYDAAANAAAIDQALNMPLEERRRRMAPMRERVMQFDAGAWARSFVNELSEVAQGKDASPDMAEARSRIRQTIAAGKPVALFLDYDGTLREIERDPAAAAPTDHVRSLLGRLIETRGVNVTIISGRTMRDLESFLGEIPVGLIAEHGASLRRPHHREWEQLDRNAGYAWKDELLRVLRLYEQSTPGSWIEEKRTSLVWHYRRADPEFGGWKAKELTEELAALTASDPVQVRHGRKIVEIASSHINKGAAVQRILEERPYDLIVCAGDDATDESMFRLGLTNLITIKVGESETQAQYRLPHPAALRAFLADATRLG